MMTVMRAEFVMAGCVNKPVPLAPAPPVRSVVVMGVATNQTTASRMPIASDNASVCRVPAVNPVSGTLAV